MSAPEAAPNGQQLAARLESLRSEFEALSRRVAMAAEGLRTRVSPPDADLLTACAAAHAGFDRLGEDFRRAIDAHGLPWPSEGLSDLEGLGALLTPLYAAEDERIKGESLRRGVIAVLDRVERLSCPAQPDFPPLAACLEQARGIRRAVEGSPPGGWPVVAHEVSEGRHPLNALLALITADESTGDEAWSGWYDAVVDAFGNPLAVAVARGRVVSPVP